MPPLRVAILCSHRAPGLTYLLDADTNRGRFYDITCCVTSEDSFAEQAAADACAIPVLVHPIRHFCQTHGCRLSDSVGRANYDGALVERLAGYPVDLIVLAGYLYVLSDRMLAAFRHRIVNIHHSDLTVRNADGTPRWPGLRAVRDAILSGVDETRATVHLVTEELDEGPPILRSWAFPVSPLVVHALRNEATDVLKAYAYAHQEWMIRATWGPLASAAIELIARKRLDLSELALISNGDAASPWDLEADGRIRGRGPLASREVTLPIARVS